MDNCDILHPVANPGGRGSKKLFAYQCTNVQACSYRNVVSIGELLRIISPIVVHRGSFTKQHDLKAEKTRQIFQ